MAPLNNISSAFGIFALSQLVTGISYISYYAYNMEYFKLLFEPAFNLFAIINGVLLLLNGLTNAITCYQNERAKKMFSLSLIMSIVVLIFNIVMTYKLKDIHGTVDESCSKNVVNILKKQGHKEVCQFLKTKATILMWCVIAAILNSFSTKICSCFGIAVNNQNIIDEQVHPGRDQEMV